MAELHDSGIAPGAHDVLRRVIALEEAERARIARELHSRAGQNIAACQLLLAELRRAGDPGRGALLEKLDELMAELATDLHRTGILLRPTVLDDLGLGAALETYLAEWSVITGIAVSADLGGVAQRLSSFVETLVFRITQEALRNVARHASARSVSVVAECSGSTLIVIVEDDGCGFDPEAIENRGRVAPGIAGMRERAALIGGTVEIESTPGHGATVYLRIPIPSAEAGA